MLVLLTPVKILDSGELPWVATLHMLSHHSRKIKHFPYYSTTRGHLEACAWFLLNVAPSAVTGFILHLFAIVNCNMGIKSV